MPPAAPPAKPPKSGPLGAVAPLAAKVPEIAVMFWAIKLLTTGIGEAASDFMGQNSVPLAAAVGVIGFFVALRLQLRGTEYRAWTYWFAVLMVAVFGTMVADGIKDGAGLSYAVTTPLFALLVTGIFYAWQRSEGTLSIHSITTTRRELFYWSAVLGTFALGTAAGDLTAITLNIGYFPSALVFAALMALPAIAWLRFGLSPVIAFWSCYVLTRPLGASFADWFSKPVPESGLGLGDGPVTAIGLIAFAALVAYVAKTKRDIQDPNTGEANAPSHLHPHESDSAAPEPARA
jgi:uncharacterized membrane-anchored protein